MKRNILLTVILLFILSVSAQQPEKQTFVYAVKGGDTLRLDKYEIASAKDKKPCVIFMFGGGFSTGTRNDDRYVPYFKSLTDLGYVVVSIDYRLGLKNPKFDEGGDVMSVVGLFNNAISMSVEDLYDATNYVIKNSHDWNVDQTRIVVCGSSAGAVAVLHAEYDICNSSELSNVLPDGFNYAGIISFAGAIFSMQGELAWKSKPAPMLLFHGDADSNVPYNKLEMGPLGFYGSKYIAGQLNEMKSAYYFYNVENAAHEIAITPMTENLMEIESFLNKCVAKKQPLMIELRVQEIGKPVLNKDFEILDYIKSNFAPH
ncbi:alpha/beta hydrolase [Dysgonomonas sp. 520]|uniref:alpha/beta hydrolase n=1 Tax=Dysgonomonas sp. 520 TaxID=2302931 RepID=UPI0013D560C4|nr:alpha/beta hydrolase [Dysgonomonas sp. 520]NDW09758.1 alpha/beta hydrolase [Dysgonomonas sp. 520]